MEWFERLTGFRETSYDDTRAKLTAHNGRLQSLVNGKSYAIGTLELASLQSLRKRVQLSGGPPGRLKVEVIQGDVRKLHALPKNRGAPFQVASQFNMLEMVSPEVTPEHGVTRYQHDHTQGPACAIAAGAATIYRNYFVPVGDRIGQTVERQLDGLAEIGKALSHALGMPVPDLWTMQNGYALCSRKGLEEIAKCLKGLQPEQLAALRGKLCIGLHSDVEVTDAPEGNRQHVSQAFCSALPVGYSEISAPHWAPFAKLVLEAAYKATMWAALANAQRGASNVVLLTSLGGGAFGNDERWIHGAIQRSLEMTVGFDLEVYLVSYDAPSEGLIRLAKKLG